MEPIANMELFANVLATAPRMVRDLLIASGYDPGVLRPWRDPVSGRNYVTLTGADGKEQHVLTNVNATLTRDAWKALDTAILRAATAPLRVVADIRGAGLTYSIPNGMGKTVLECQRMTDVNDATMAMDPTVIGANDRPEFDSTYLPLPVTFKDFSYNIRELEASRNGAAPLDTTMGEASGRKVAEMVEKVTLGVSTGVTYGGGTIYGFTNATGIKIDKTMTSPASTGWTAPTTLAEVLDMKALSQAAYHYGPWMLYFSPSWDQYLDNDMSTNYPNKTLRMRLREIDGIQDVRTANYLTGYTAVLCEMNAETVRMVIGLDVTTLEWDELGGLRKNFKVMTIMVPHVRADINGNSGIVHGAV